MTCLQDVHPRRDGLREDEVCCRFNRSADTITDVLLISRDFQNKRELKQEKERKRGKQKGSPNCRRTPRARLPKLIMFSAPVAAVRSSTSIGNLCWPRPARRTSFRGSSAGGGRLASECTFQRLLLKKNINRLGTQLSPPCPPRRRCLRVGESGRLPRVLRAGGARNRRSG